jgi:short-subunit dehydrogenase
MSTFRQRYGPWGLVTGASSGIGAEFARQLAERGLNIILVARREARLTALAETLREAHGIEARVLALDLSRDDFLPALDAATRDLEVNLVVSCAGYSVTGELVENDLDRQATMVQLNARAPLMLAHHFGRAMKARRRGGIIFVSSIVGYVATPFWTAYSATKAYLLFLGEGLFHELRPYSVDALAFCPGTTRTEFLEVAEIDGFLPMNVRPVVSKAFASLGKRPTLVPGWHNWLLTWFPRLLPRRFNSFMSGQIMKFMTRGR